MTDENKKSENRVLALIHKEGFQSELAQIQSKSLLSEITDEIPQYNWKYDTHRLTRNALICSFELENLAIQNPDYINERLSEAAKKIATLWESLGHLDECYLNETNMLNAALNYELAGYSANAICLSKKINYSSSETSGLSSLVSLYIQRKFLILIKTSNQFLNEPELGNGISSSVINDMALAFTSKGFLYMSDFFFKGNSNSLNDAIESFNNAEYIFTKLLQFEESNLIRSIRSLIPLMESRSTWTLLKKYAPNDPKWNLYIKLLARGVGKNVIEGNSISELWISQIYALKNGLLSDDNNKIIKMPTSAGKTRIAEMAIVHTLIKDPKAKCIYVAPYRALVSELQQSFFAIFSDLGYRISSITGSYESDDFEELLFKKTDILILTPEKLDLLFRSKPEFLDNLKLVILDEMHIIDDNNRGIKFELLITRLKRKINHAKFITLSAVVPQETLEDLAEWFNDSNTDGIIKSSWRPSIQRYAKFDWQGDNGTIRYASEEDNDILETFVPGIIKQHYLNDDFKIFPHKTKKYQIAAELGFKFGERGPVLIFSPNPKNVESIAKSLIEIIKIEEESNNSYFNDNGKIRSIILAEEWLGSEHLITKSLKHGIALHHGRIPQIVGDAILNDFRQKKYQFIVANNTLAQGVNLPIKTVIIHSCYRFNYNNNTNEKISAREYWNIAGRAGRATEETEGLIIHIAISNNDKSDFEYYLMHKDNVEPVYGALYNDLVDLINGNLTEEAIKEELDPEILALLVEEGNISAEVIDEILIGSISQIQAKKNQFPFEKIRKIFIDSAEEMNETIPDPKIKALFSTTGLKTKSCKLIYTHVEENVKYLNHVFLDHKFRDIESLINPLLSILTQIHEMGPNQQIELDYKALLLSWLNGDEINQISLKFVDKLGIEDLTRIIGDYFSYKLPWGISSYLNIASEILGINKTDLSDYIKFLPSMIKFGVPDPIACWAMSIGITSRRVAIDFAKKYRIETETPNYEDFLEWANNLAEDTLRYEFNLKSPLIEDVSTSIINSSYNELLSNYIGLNQTLPLFVKLEGINYGERQKNLINSKIGVKVKLVRNYKDFIDRNSILVYLFNKEIGYIPRQVAQILAIELDTGTKFDCRIINFDEYSDDPIIEINLLEE
jgi:superfamily II DNA/RNA helicase